METDIQKSLGNMIEFLQKIKKKDACTGVGLEFGHERYLNSDGRYDMIRTGNSTIRITYDENKMFPPPPKKPEVIEYCRHKENINYCRDCANVLDDGSQCPRCGSEKTKTFGVGDEYEFTPYFKCEKCKFCRSID